MNTSRGYTKRTINLTVGQIGPFSEIVPLFHVKLGHVSQAVVPRGSCHKLFDQMRHIVKLGRLQDVQKVDFLRSQHVNRVGLGDLTQLEQVSHFSWRVQTLVTLDVGREQDAVWQWPENYLVFRIFCEVALRAQFPRQIVLIFSAFSVHSVCHHRVVKMDRERI